MMRIRALLGVFCKYIIVSLNKQLTSLFHSCFAGVVIITCSPANESCQPGADLEYFGGGATHLNLDPLGSPLNRLLMQISAGGYFIAILLIIVLLNL